MDKKRKKTIVFSILVATGMLLPLNLSAQEQYDRLGGLFGKGIPTENSDGGLMNRSNVSGGLNNQAFGQNVPLGSELLILLGAATCYAVIKKKED